MENKPKVYFRADGNSEIGLGHVIRSLALAEMLKNDFECYFIIREPIPTLKEQIVNICVGIMELRETDNSVLEAEKLTTLIKSGEIIVLDGYHFITAYQNEFKKKSVKVVCIDDIHAYHFVADVVINHSGGLSELNFSKEKYTAIYHGLEYALLRKPFRIAAQNRTYHNKVSESIFICFGGADPKNDTLDAIKKCENAKNFDKYFVVLGSAYQYRNLLEAYIQDSHLDVEVLSDLSAQAMADIMQQCNYAITPPSSVAYEYLSTGGVLFLKVIADNQANMYDYFIKEGIAFPLSSLGKVAPKKSNFEKQSFFFDGKQSGRLTEIFKQL